MTHPQPLEAILHGEPSRYAVPNGWKQMRDCTAEDLRWHIRQRMALHHAKGIPQNHGCQAATGAFQILIEQMEKQGVGTVGELEMEVSVHFPDDAHWGQS